MKLYHRTDKTAVYTGVWLSNRPLDDNESVHGSVLLSIAIPVRELRAYEWVEEHKSYREFLVPAKLVNHYGPAVVEEDEDDGRRRWR